MGDSVPKHSAQTYGTSVQKIFQHFFTTTLKKAYSATRWVVQSSSSNETIWDHRSSGTCTVKRRARLAIR